MKKQSSRLPAILCACLIAGVFGVIAIPATAQVTVTSANPNNAPQGTTNLNVTVAGSGFDRGSSAKWYVSGTTNTGGVVVNSTTFVSSSQLTANITIPDTAIVSGYDVSVTTKSGRTGVGSDLFTVNPEAVTSNLYSTDTSNNPATVSGDGVLTNASGASVYDNTPENCAEKITIDCVVKSVLPSDYILKLYAGSGRTVQLTFETLGNSPDESGLNGPYLGQISVHCYDASNNVMDIPTAIAPYTSYNRCGLAFDFVAASGTSYRYNMSPTWSPAEGWTTVACTGAITKTINGQSTQVCNAWSVTPTPSNLLPNPSLANVANLYTVSKSGLKFTFVGQYKMTFDLTLTQP